MSDSTAASSRADATVPAANTNFIASPAALKERIKTELNITKPDFVVFVPSVTDTEVTDTGNEHFLVFDGPDGSLMVVWTQAFRHMEQWQLRANWSGQATSYLIAPQRQLPVIIICARTPELSRPATVSSENGGRTVSKPFKPKPRIGLSA